MGSLFIGVAIDVIFMCIPGRAKKLNRIIIDPNQRVTGTGKKFTLAILCLSSQKVYKANDFYAFYLTISLVNYYCAI